MGITIPEADGGQGGSLMDAVIAIEQTAAVCPRSADVVQFGNFGPIRTFAEYGTDYQKKKWLTECLAGNAVISLGMSEPDAGSAATDLKTSAKPDGKNYIVNGTKVFSTFSPEAAVFLVYVRYGPGVGGIGSVLIERGTPGFTVGPPQEFMSGEQWSELHFENCRIPAENVLLGPGGFKKQMASFNVERLGNTARSLAFGRYCYERAREHAGVRQQFGRPLAEFQGLQWKFADMAIKLEGAQLLLYRAAANADKGLPSAYETAVAKAACNQTGLRGRARGGADHGRGRLQQIVAGRILHAALPRLDDRRRLDRDAEEPHRRARVRPPIRPAPAQAENLRGGGVTKPLAQVLLAPQSVAIIGQSNDATKTAGRPLKYLRQAGYAGRIYPINPRRDEVLGERAWPSLADLPEVPEHAYIVASTDATMEAIEECGRIGVPVVTALANGFSETGAEGTAREARIRQLLKDSGTRLVGPSSLGVVDLRHKTFLTANAAFDEPDLPVGRIFAASHSGGMIGTFLSRGKARGIHFAGLVSVGNEVDLSIGEICAATLDDPGIDGYVLFLETMRKAAGAARLRAGSGGARQAGAGLQARPLGGGARACGLAHRRARRRGRHRRHVPRRMRHRPRRYAGGPDRGLPAAGARAGARARRTAADRRRGHHHRRRRHHGGRSAGHARHRGRAADAADAGAHQGRHRRRRRRRRGSSISRSPARNTR